MIHDILHIAALEVATLLPWSEDDEDAPLDLARADLVPEVVGRAHDEVVDAVAIEVGEQEGVAKVGVGAAEEGGNSRLDW